MTSKYFEELEKEAKQRYLTKIASIKKDPYDLRDDEKSRNLDDFPQITDYDIYNYLVLGKSYYTGKDFKAYKSLEAYNQFICGWVSNVFTTKVGEISVISGKVKHSQRLRETPLEPWVISSMDGIIESAHCTCMAGLGECCVHIAALLFFVDDLIRKKEDQTPTMVPAYWKAPVSKTVEFAEIKDINFSTPVMDSFSEKQLDENLPSVPEMTDEEFKRVAKDLHDANSKSCFLMLIPDFNSVNEEKQDSLDLTKLFKESNLKLSLKELLSETEKIDISMSATEAKSVEGATRQQYKSRKWFKLRAGRITASNFKSACITRIAEPALSTVKRICYPINQGFYSKSAAWGCKHESLAKKEYFASQKMKHQNLNLCQSGLILNPQYAFMGASPDALVSCDCCGLGCLEIKCPYCLKDSDNSELKSHSCLELVNGRNVLSKKHSYYYQLQAQLFLSCRSYADFVLWSQNGLTIIRVMPDEPFWQEKSERARLFHQKVILPELLGKVFTDPRNNRPHVVMLNAAVN